MAHVATSGRAVLAEEPAAEVYEAQGYIQLSWRRLRRQRGAMVALAALLAICAITLASPWIDASVLHLNPDRGVLSQRFQPPSAQHFLGTDDFGRDSLARLIVAGRVSLTIGFMVAAISLTFGVALGLIAGYYRESWTTPSMR